MMKRKAMTMLMALVVAAGAGVWAAKALADHHLAGENARVKLSYLMAGTMNPNFRAARGAARTAPADDDAWEALAINAALLNELSYSIMEAGRAKDEVWQKAAVENLRAGSAALLAAAEAKDGSAIGAAIQTIGGSCRSCHDVHRK